MAVLARRKQPASIRWLRPALGALLALVTASAPAFAGHGGGFHPARPTVAFYTCNLETNTHTAFHDNDSHDIEPTDVQTALIHDCVPGAEVYMNDAGYGTDDPTGWYECHRLVNNICENGHIHINISYANIPEDVNRTLALICEEVGHSVGLDHRFGEATTCMSEFIDARHLDAHDKAVLNTNF